MVWSPSFILDECNLLSQVRWRNYPKILYYGQKTTNTCFESWKSSLGHHFVTLKGFKKKIGWWLIRSIMPKSPCSLFVSESSLHRSLKRIVSKRTILYRTVSCKYWIEPNWSKAESLQPYNRPVVNNYCIPPEVSTELIHESSLQLRSSCSCCTSDFINGRD